MMQPPVICEICGCKRTMDLAGNLWLEGDNEECEQCLAFLNQSAVLD